MIYKAYTQRVLLYSVCLWLNSLINSGWLIVWLTDWLTEWLALHTHNSLYISLFVFGIVWFALHCFGLLWLPVCWPRSLAPFVGLLLWLYTCLHSQWPHLPHSLPASCLLPAACHLLPPLCGPNLFAWLTPLKVVKPFATANFGRPKGSKQVAAFCL